MKKDMMKKIIGFMMIGMLLVAAGCSKSSTGIKDGGTPQNAEAEEAADNRESTETTEQQVYVFNFSDAVTTEGEMMSSEVFANSKLTMVNVWATFCGPCINEMPDLGELATAFDPAEFQLIGIVSDALVGDGEMLAEAQSIIDETGANYPHLLLNEELYVNLVGASDSVPTTYFFNQKGELLGYLIGAQSKEGWEEIIHELLDEVEK